MQLYQRLLGLPLVYNHIRPLVIGGIDMTPSYRNLSCTAEDVVLDVGCGTGGARNHLLSVKSVRGVDNEAGAIAFARKRASGRSDVTYRGKLLSVADLERIQPTRVMMRGLLHHLSDDEAISLIEMCVACPSARRIATQD